MEIDYVIAWVDGNDPKHKEARRRYPPDGSTHKEAKGQQRFCECGEVYYNIASVLKYAPFIRRIFIVTDNQKPKHLDAFVRAAKCEPSFIKVVSHDEIFDGLNAARPNFNSLSIEAALWRIPGLAEHFVYANDDLFLNAPVQEDDFFRNGVPVIHGFWNSAEDRRMKYKFLKSLEKITLYRYKYNTPRFRISQWRSAILAGITDRVFRIHHYPHPIRKVTLKDYFTSNPEILTRQVAYRYRHIDQFNPVSLAHHLEIARYGTPVEDRKDFVYLDSARVRRLSEEELSPELDRIASGTVPFGCIQGFDTLRPDLMTELHRILIAKFSDTLPREIADALTGRTLARPIDRQTVSFGQVGRSEA